MKSYDLTYIISPTVTADQADGEAKNIESLIQSKEGVVLRSERVSIQTIAYPIKKQSSGYFAGLTFQAPEATLKEVKAALEKNSHILRHLLTIKKVSKPMKPSRARKFATSPLSRINEESPYIKSAEHKSETEKPIDIDKKLDELLNQ